MKISEIYEYLDTLSPFELQESWDNSALLLGDLDQEVAQVYLSLDASLEQIEHAAPNSLFIVHHPLIFKGLKDLAGEAYPRNLIKKMLEKNIALIAMHTNYDKTHLNAYFTEQILGFKEFRRDEFLIYARFESDFKALIEHIKKSLNLKYLRTSAIKNLHAKCGEIAICTGSGSELVPMLKKGVKCFLTGDLKYHAAFEAMHNELVLVDIGHFESERYFGESLAKHLQNLQIKVIISPCKNPFEIF